MIKNYKVYSEGDFVDTDAEYGDILVGKGVATYNVEVPNARNKMISTKKNRKVYKKKPRKAGK